MENKLPPDRLDAFLQKMLEDYTPAPPDDIWAGIEAELPQPAVAPTPLRYPFNPAWWAAAAVAAVMLGVIAFQHWHYNGQIEKLSARLELEKAAEGTSGTGLADNNQASQAIIAEAVMGGAPPNGQFTAKAAAVSGNIAANGKAPRNAEANPAALQYTDEQYTRPRRPARSDAAGSGEVTERQQPEQITTAMRSEALRGLPAAQLIGVINRQYDLHSGQPFALAAPSTQTAVLKPRWALKARIMPMRTRIQLSAPPAPDPGPGGPGGGPGSNRDRIFADPEVINGAALATGLMVERSIAGRWTLSAGADLLRTEATTAHDCDFEIRERDHHGGGHGHPPRPRQSHDFDYNLHTAAGLTSVSLRVTEVDTMRMLDENEVVQFVVNTRQRTTRVAFPLLLGYRIERSRWSIQPKLGLMAGFTFERGVDVTGVVISGAENIFEANVKPASDLEERLTFGLDAAASLSLAYRITPEWEVGVEPTLMHSIGQWSGGPDANARALGIAAYAAYRF